ncbi:N-alpha-acetyltransferase 35, NatC auxiliary subunit [Halyomorpha halys]|uniref:N-alpha-acetyltransferase 35, NatC auxiliary subunit n=1 Tax=Halyomorpha halys TaxID=286706 RepID=UPI0006D4DDF2|nr:N-alpha-acetyltransferase 35, NatC auxiliary subunit [Halyomorpha halys]
MHMTDVRNLSPTLSTAFVPDVCYNWVNITDEFFKNIKELQLGELLHDDLFGLFEAMSAIEMMDPKMDAGMLCNRGNKAPLTLTQAIEKNILQVEDIPYGDQIAIIDTTWACIVSWLDGHSLVQTVFTNLYLHNPHVIQDRPLKSFCIAVYKLIDIIKEFVSRGLVFEEEDFQPMGYGYRLNPDVSEIRTLGMLKEVEEELNRKRRTNFVDVDADFVSALTVRIRFTRLLLQAFMGLSKKDINPNIVLESTKLLITCSDSIAFIITSVNKGSPPAYISEVHGPVTIGFDPLVNQRLLPPTFPRYTHIKSPVESYRRLDDLLCRLRQITKIVSYTSFHLALELMLEVSSSKPCIVTRSVMQLLYLPQCSRAGDTINCIDAIRDAARAFISPPVLMPRSQLLNNPQVKDFLECFLGHCVRPFSNLIQLCGHNRARQRDKLAHLLEDFANLQDEAERVDAYLHSLSKKCENVRPHLACFGTWVLYHTLRVMIMFLLSGFELELYSTHEYHYIFWYLYEFLYGWLVSSLSRADAFLSEQEILNEQNKTKRRCKSKLKKKARPYAKEITINQALQNMCGGYYKAMVGFRKDGKLVLPHPEFDCEKVRYEHRFSPFINVLLTPPPVQYSEFKEMTDSLEHSNSQSLYLAGCKHFHQARTLLESIHNPDQEITELIRISKTNFVVLKLLATHKLDSSSPLDFDFSAHHHFPIMKIC